MRRDGKTTRLIDAAIQELFKKGIVYIPRGADAVKLFSKDGRRGYGDDVYYTMLRYVDYDFEDDSNKLHPAIQDNFASRFRRRLYSEHEFADIINDGFIYKIKK